MYRSDFTGILNHFSSTIGQENGLITFYKQYNSNDNMGYTGGQLKEYKTAQAIVLIATSSGLELTKGHQNLTINSSVRTTEGDLVGCYFYYKNLRYKITKRRDIEGTMNRKLFYHYECVEG